MNTIEIIELIGLGIVVAANPLPVIAQLALVTRDGGRSAAVGLAMGWAGTLFAVLGLLVTGTVAVIGALFGFGGDGAEPADDPGVLWVPLVLGIALVVLGALSWVRKPRETASPLMKTLDALTPGKALAWGAGFAVLKPKTIAALFAASAIIGSDGRPMFPAVLLVLLVTAVGSLGVVVPLLLSVVGGARVEDALRTAQRGMERHSSRITGGLLVVVGVLLIVFGLGSASG